MRWPDRGAVQAAAREWARREAERRPELLRLGIFGSCARGDWGVGSDLDLVAVVERSDEPFERRAVSWDLLPLPVPADLLVYDAREWASLADRNDRFARMLRDETIWIFERAGA